MTSPTDNHVPCEPCNASGGPLGKPCVFCDGRGYVTVDTAAAPNFDDGVPEPVQACPICKHPILTEATLLLAKRNLAKLKETK